MKNNVLIPFLLILFCKLDTIAQNDSNIFLITLDGLRWEEVFGGAVDSMMQNETLTKNQKYIQDKYRGETKEEARKKLMPFFWNTIAKEGVLIGNQWKDSKMFCTNRFWFSYPGYNEILTGYSDPDIDSNAKKYNENKTVLEWLHEKDPLQGQVAAFGSWDVFPYIINDKRSGIPVNAGYSKAEGNLTEKERILNQLQDEVSGPWRGVRLDAFTHNYMMEYIKKNHPRVVYISYGETDDFAHDGRYDHYLESAHKTDQWIKEIWEYIQKDPYYRYNTNIVITTDHGRGDSPMEEWKSHGTIYRGSNAIWAAAIGPDIKALGEIQSGQNFYQDQIASTVAKLMGYDYQGGKYPAGKPIKTIFNDE